MLTEITFSPLHIKLGLMKQFCWSTDPFKYLFKDILGKIREQNYIEVVRKHLRASKYLVTIKVHFLPNYVADFLKNLGALGEKQVKRFHQYLKAMEARYESRLDVPSPEVDSPPFKLK